MFTILVPCSYSNFKSVTTLQILYDTKLMPNYVTVHVWVCEYAYTYQLKESNVFVSMCELMSGNILLPMVGV